MARYFYFVQNIKMADLVLIFFNNYYQSRDNCRAEATFARKNNKPMLFVDVEKSGKVTLEDWFEAIILDELYISFFKETDPYQQIIKQIGLKLNLQV